MFVCLFAVNAKTMAWVDAKCSGIMKNNPESVLSGLKSSVLMFLERYCDISSFSFTADCHFYLSPFHFRLTLKSVHMLCRLISTHAHYPEALSHCGHRHDIASVAQLSVVNIADSKSAFIETLASECFRRNAVDSTP